MADKRTPMEQDDDGIVGAIGEEIFERLFKSLDYMVFRTGHESVVQGMLDLTKLRKDEFLASIKKKKTETSDEKLVRHLEFGLSEEKQQLSKRDNSFQEIASSPDFTVISPYGDLDQWEVKVRADGVLDENCKKRILSYHRHTKVFIISSVSINGDTITDGKCDFIRLCSVQKWEVERMEYIEKRVREMLVDRFEENFGKLFSAKEIEYMKKNPGDKRIVQEAILRSTDELQTEWEEQHPENERSGEWVFMRDRWYPPDPKDISVPDSHRYEYIYRVESERVKEDGITTHFRKLAWKWLVKARSLKVT